MPRYIYRAKSSPDKIIQGDIEAASEQEVVSILTKMGLFPVSIQTEDYSQHPFGIAGHRFRTITKAELSLFTSQLASLIDAGVSILNGLAIIANQTSNKQFKVILRDIASRIQNGQSFSDSCTAFTQIFSTLYVAMVRTGETSGSLNVTLKRLAEYLEKEEEFKNSLRAALVYPAFVFIVGCATILVLLLFVIPRLVSMFEDMGQALPLPTAVLINTSDFLRHNGWIFVIFIAVAIFIVRRFYRMPQGRLAFDAARLKLPVVGAIAMKTEVSCLMRTLALLIAGAMPITSSLEVAKQVIQNQIVAQAVRTIKEKVSAGERFSNSLKNSKLFSDFVVNIIGIGEETGSLDKALGTIAGDYERDVDRALKLFARLLEPVLILIMGAAVGFIVIAMLLPIFQINLIVN